MKEFDTVLEILNRRKKLGYSEQANGVRLIGHVPHVGPQAFFHEVFPPITKDQFKKFRREVEVEVPGVYQDFLFQSNGLILFSGAVQFYGVCEELFRDPANRQPFCGITANTSGRPKDANPSFLFIGSYRKDGSRIYIDNETLTVYRCSRNSSDPLKRWWDFWEMLISEVTRLDDVFDAGGNVIDPELILPP